MRKYVQNLAIEIKTIKLFMTEQLYSKKSVSEIKSSTSTVGSTIKESTELLRKDDGFLTHENASKNFMIKVLAQN